MTRSSKFSAQPSIFVYALFSSQGLRQLNSVDSETLEGEGWKKTLS
jgi:hypothetical protein